MNYFIIGLLFSLNSYAATFKIKRPCEDKIIINTQVAVMTDESVGDFTIRTLKKLQIPFKGSSVGIHSIFNTPNGLDALEVISNTQMYAYGWCYSINGIGPESYPSEITISSDDEILWWFGYAEQLNGTWVTQCISSEDRSNGEVCRDILE